MAAAARSMLLIHIFTAERYIIMERLVSDTCTMCWEIYWVHPESAHRLFVGTLRWVVDGNRLLPLTRRKSADRHRQIDADRISENNCSQYCYCSNFTYAERLRLQSFIVEHSTQHSSVSVAIVSVFIASLPHVIVSVTSVCVSDFTVWALTSQSLDVELETSLLVCRYVFTMSSSALYIKVIVWWSRSQQEILSVCPAWVPTFDSFTDKLHFHLHFLVYGMFVEHVGQGRVSSVMGSRSYGHN